MQNYKSCFPFKICTTSYIIPVKEDNLIQNVNFLKKSFHKIQLLFFGKDYLQEVMSESILDELLKIKQECNIEFIVHLPIDLDLLNPDQNKLAKSLQVIKHIFTETKRLDILEYVLHIDRSNSFQYPKIQLNKRTKNNFNRVLNKLKETLTHDTKKIHIENLAYDLTFFADTIITNGFKICFDIGHIFFYKQDFQKFIQTFSEAIQVIHLHGYHASKDHLSLKLLDQKELAAIKSFLNNYSDYVIIEVFNENDLNDSLRILQKFYS